MNQELMVKDPEFITVFDLIQETGKNNTL